MDVLSNTNVLLCYTFLVSLPFNWTSVTLDRYRLPVMGRRRSMELLVEKRLILIRYLHVLAFMQKRMIMIPKHLCIAWIAMEWNQVLQNWYTIYLAIQSGSFAYTRMRGKWWQEDIIWDQLMKPSCTTWRWRQLNLTIQWSDQELGLVTASERILYSD